MKYFSLNKTVRSTPGVRLHAGRGGEKGKAPSLELVSNRWGPTPLSSGPGAPGQAPGERELGRPLTLRSTAGQLYEVSWFQLHVYQRHTTNAVKRKKGRQICRRTCKTPANFH